MPHGKHVFSVEKTLAVSSLQRVMESEHLTKLSKIPVGLKLILLRPGARPRRGSALLREGMLQPGESGARLLHFGLQLLQVNAGNGVKGAAHIAISSMLMILYELTYPFAICFQCVFNRACFPVGQTDSCEHLLQDVAGHCCLLLQPYYHFPTKTTGCQSHAKSRIYILIHFKLHTLIEFCSMRHINCEWQKRKDPPCKAMGTRVTTLRLATDSPSAATQPAAPLWRLFP